MGNQQGGMIGLLRCAHPGKACIIHRIDVFGAFREGHPAGLTKEVLRQTWVCAVRVLLEVADRTYPGLAQYLFRETCRTALAEGAEYINAMDDAGLAGLRASKQAYRPAMLIPNFVASPAPES